MTQIVRYGLLGIAIYGASLLLMYVLVDALGLRELTSYAMVQVLIFLVGLVLGRRWVFSSQASALTIAPRFFASTILFRCLNWGVFTLSTQLLLLPRELGILIAIGSVLPAKYWTERSFVFNPGGPSGLPKPSE